MIISDDILRAIDKLKVLGNGFELIPLGSGRFLVQSVPGELNMDHTRVLQLAEVALPRRNANLIAKLLQDAAYVTKELIMDRMRWDERRVDAVLVGLLGGRGRITSTDEAINEELSDSPGEGRSGVGG